MPKDSVIVGLTSRKQKGEIIISPPTERIVGRRIAEWSAYCGTYGMGGPGFFGLRVEATSDYPEEWLILRLWGAPDWLNVNGRWLEANPGQYSAENRPLHSNFANAKWDEFSALVCGKSITGFELKRSSFTLAVGETLISLSEDPSTRPVYAGTGEQRTVSEQDDLGQAWIMAPWPWVQV